MKSLDELIAILKAFPLKTENLDEKSILNESINLFGSLMLHRVRSLLSDYFPDSDFEGLTEKSTLGEILLILNKNFESATCKPIYEEPSNSNYSGTSSSYIQSNLATKENQYQVVSVGIDIESINAFPTDVLLPSGAPFRSRTFCPIEIAYALTKHSPSQTLLGIFCAKEAVIKCLSGYRRLTFRDIQITHDSNGRPLCNVPDNVDFNFKVSISHSFDCACACALMEYSVS